MKILQSVQNSLMFLGVYPPQAFENSLRLNVRIVFVVVAYGLFGIGTTMFFFFEAETLLDYSDSLFAFSGVDIGFLMLTIILIKAVEVFKLIESFEAIIQRRLKNTRTKIIFERTNQQVEKWTGLMWLYIGKLTPALVLLSCALEICYTYYTGDLKEEDFRLPYPCWFPFNFRIPTGYFMAFFIECIVFPLSTLIIAFLMCFFVGTCMWVLALTEDIKLEYNHLTEIYGANGDGDGDELKQNFCETIQLHSDAIQCANELAKIYKHILAGNLLWSLLTICGTLLMVETELSNDVINLGFAVNLIVKMNYSFALIFLFCEMSERVRASFEMINDAIYEMDWTAFPIETQRMMPVILAVAQRPVQLQAFGTTACSRQTFKSVSSTAYTYFTILRELH